MRLAESSLTTLHLVTDLRCFSSRAVPSCKTPDGTLFFYGLPKKSCACLREWLLYLVRALSSRRRSPWRLAWSPRRAAHQSR